MQRNKKINCISRRKPPKFYFWFTNICDENLKIFKKSEAFKWQLDFIYGIHTIAKRELLTDRNW